jgi:hypothetical protein
MEARAESHDSAGVHSALQLDRSLQNFDLPFCDEVAAAPDRFKKDSSQLALNLRGKNSGDCGFYQVLVEAAKKSDGDIRESLKSVNWDPCCLPNTVKSMMGKVSENVSGFMIGFDTGISKTLAVKLGPGVNYGREMVVIRSGPDSLQVAVVEYKGVGLGVGLSLGASVTQGLLYGDCKEIGDYLGYFKSYNVGGMRFENMGMSSHPLDFGAKRTRCDSKSLVSGGTTTLVGIQGSYYSQVSKSIRLRGPQIRPLLELMDKAERDSMYRKAHPDVNRKAGFNEKDYRRPACNDDLIEQAAGQSGGGLTYLAGQLFGGTAHAKPVK